MKVKLGLGCAKLSLPISGYLRLSWAILGYIGLCRAISGNIMNLLQFETFLGWLWISTWELWKSRGGSKFFRNVWIKSSQAISGYLCLSLAISGYLGLSLAISSYLKLSQAIIGYLRLSWDISSCLHQVEAGESKLMLFQNFFVLSFIFRAPKNYM